MSKADITDLNVTDLDEAGLIRLIAAGEVGGAERKAGLPAGGLGPSVAAFANSGGGWLLLGVRDDGTICGFKAPGRAHAHDWVRDQLQAAVDPLPEFRTATVSTANGDVIVIRVLPSAVTPHLVRATGVVYVRVPGGKRPADSQAKLLAMSESSQDAEARAVARLSDPPLVREALAGRMQGATANGQTRVADWVIAAAPLQVSSDFAARVLAHESVRGAESAATVALRHLTESTLNLHLATRPQSRGFVLAGSHGGTRDELQLTVDAGGTTVARWSTRLFRGVEHLPGLSDDVLLPLLRLVSAPLAAAGTEGIMLLHAYLLVTPIDNTYGPAITVTAADRSGELVAGPSPVFLGGRACVTVDADLRCQADAWMRELGRAAGIEMWER
jgi:hypothetical protein